MDILKYQGVVEDILKKLRVPIEHREDMSQTCYLELLEKQHLLETSDNPMSYAAVLCRNRVLDEWQSEKLKIPAESLDDPKTHHKAVKIPAVYVKFDEELIREAMKTLSEEESDVVTRLYVEGCHRAEVAAALGVHTSTVDRRMRSGVAKLKSYFGVV